MGTPPAEAVPAEPGDTARAEGARSREASQQLQQGSREASQQPQAGAPQQPASSSQLAGGSKLSAGSGGSLKRPRGSGGAKGGEESKQVVYGKEVVGRQVGVWNAKAADWPKAVVAQYNAAAGQHLLRYLERPAGSIKHHEEWVCLARTRFQWLAAPPPQAKPNPSWDGAPRGDDAVGFKVRAPPMRRPSQLAGCCCTCGWLVWWNRRKGPLLPPPPLLRCCRCCCCRA